MPHYDIIIVGARPAGASLAIRLGQAGLRVLLLERATFPSLPAVSSPGIGPVVLKLLDEVGAVEANYAHNTPPIKRWVIGHREQWSATIPMPLRDGRDYGYAVDRARFDAELWRVATQTPNVTARDQFSVSDIKWADDRVIGVVRQGSQVVETADCVVGADGRYSLVARKVQAQTYAEYGIHPTALYYAYWAGLQPCDTAGTAFHMVNSGLGAGLLLMESADGTAAVAVEGRAERLAFAGAADAFYDNFLRSQPYIWRRFTTAKRITEVRGIKKIGNCYRTPGGPGWALVGDALHQKDPLDGQGIYDALFTAKALAEVLIEWRAGCMTWPQALAQYHARVHAETWAMYRATLERVRREIYNASPEWLIRWVGLDPEYRRRFALLITRSLSPRQWLPLSLVLRACWRGFWRDLHVGGA